MSQAGVQPLRYLRGIKNLSGNSVAICFIQDAKSERKPSENCMYACHYNTGYGSPHQQTCDTTHEASFKATISITLLIHVLLTAARSLNTSDIFSITTIMTSYKLIHNSYTYQPQYQQYKIYMFKKNIMLLSLTNHHSYETVVELCSIKHFITQPNKTKLTSNEI